MESDFLLLHKGCWREAWGHIGEEVRFTKTIPSRDIGVDLFKISQGGRGNSSLEVSSAIVPFAFFLFFISFFLMVFSHLPLIITCLVLYYMGMPVPLSQNSFYYGLPQLNNMAKIYG